MDEKAAGSKREQMMSPSTQTTAEQTAIQVPPQRVIEHRQAYGTAKTENLRDSGLWRIILPALVIIFCIILFIIPLMILIPLLYNSIQAFNNHQSTEGQLIWLWVSMIVIEVGIAIVVARGILKIFLTQAGNYKA
jgi:hypothetical protein